MLMPDCLQGDQAPPTSEQWEAIDRVVVETAEGILVGRRVISLAGAFGPGGQGTKSDTVGGAGSGEIDLLGVTDGESVEIA